MVSICGERINMKKTTTFIVILTLILSLLTGCGSAAAPSVEKVGMPNPMKELSSLEELNDEVGCCIKSMSEYYMCDDFADENFTLIDGTPRIAQYRFTLAGIPVTVRAAIFKDDISGIYMDGGKMPHEMLNSDRIYDPIDTGYGIWTRWFVGGMQYSLLVGDGKDYSIKIAETGSGNLLMLCTDLRDYFSLVFPWYQEPYYEYSDYDTVWEDPANNLHTDFEGTFASRQKLAEMNEGFGKSFGTGTAEPFAEMLDYSSAKHKKTVTVSDINELLDAIAPNTEIILEPGEYKISDARGYGETDGDYYYWADSYEGSQLIISDVENLAITGPILENDGMVSLDSIICTDPRYANVLQFERCGNLSLAGLTIGHTPGLEGYCTGGVVMLNNCSSISITGCELFGCGTYGIEAENCEELHVEDSVIRSCTYGHTSLSGCSGVSFLRCSFLGSEGFTGNYVSFSGDVSFTDCDFAYNNLVELFYTDREDSMTLNNCFIVDNALENGIFSPNGCGVNVNGGACVELSTEPGTWFEIACG